MTPEQHAATIRNALKDLRLPGEDPFPALDALVALAGRTEELESELATATTTAEFAIRKLEAAEERASQLEHERDECVKGREAYSRLGSQARLEADQLRAALERIEASGIPGRNFRSPVAFYIHLQNVARVALAGVQAKERP